MSGAAALIARFGLERHPEGGWYKETFRTPAKAGEEAGERAGASAILFLLETGEKSHWHRVDGSEIWFWHAGNPLILRIAADDSGPVESFRLGPDIGPDSAGGDGVQQLVPAHYWQAAEALPGAQDYALMSCVVSPAFAFSGFTLAAPGWEPGEGPPS